MPSWLTEESGSITLHLHVQPGAKRTEVAGIHGDSLKLRLAAPPVDGKANDELIRFLAAQFGVPQRQLKIIGGASSRSKRVTIQAPAKRPDRGW